MQKNEAKAETTEAPEASQIEDAEEQAKSVVPPAGEEPQSPPAGVESPSHSARDESQAPSASEEPPATIAGEEPPATIAGEETVASPSGGEPKQDITPAAEEEVEEAPATPASQEDTAECSGHLKEEIPAVSDHIHHNLQINHFCHMVVIININKYPHHHHPIIPILIIDTIIIISNITTSIIIKKCSPSLYSHLTIVVTLMIQIILNSFLTIIKHLLCTFMTDFHKASRD